MKRMFLRTFVVTLVLAISVGAVSVGAVSVSTESTEKTGAVSENFMSMVSKSPFGTLDLSNFKAIECGSKNNCMHLYEETPDNVICIEDTLDNATRSCTPGGNLIGVMLTCSPFGSNCKVEVYHEYRCATIPHYHTMYVYSHFFITSFTNPCILH